VTISLCPICSSHICMILAAYEPQHECALHLLTEYIAYRRMAIFTRSDQIISRLSQPHQADQMLDPEGMGLLHGAPILMVTCGKAPGACWHMSFIHSIIYFTLPTLQISCVAANSLWQPDSLPCLVNLSTISTEALVTADHPWHNPPVVSDSCLSLKSHPYDQTALTSH